MSLRDRSLPIFELEHRLAAEMRRSNRLILRAPTGSGKSTQIPQLLLDHGLAGSGEVVVLQPRRIAARMLAARVAKERGTELGQEIGYQVRFDSRVSRSTRIRYVTEGLVLRQVQADPALSGVSVVVFDEFHERHLHGDVTLALALQLQRTIRPDLKLVVMSATLGIEALEKYLSPCATLESSGRQFPVDIRYRGRALGEREQLWDAAVSAFEQCASEAAGGHTLVFMPGAHEIARTLSALQASPAARGYAVLPLHGELPAEQQDAAVAESDRPRIIVSTNVAETSLTIAGVRLVIDSGYARVAAFDPGRGINTLRVERISRASADQRAGRAGRTGPGVCLRLWTERDHQARPLEEIPEIRRLDFSETLLALKAAGTADVRALPWMEPPEERSLARAESLLRDLGAMDATGALTETGLRMAAFPVHPRYSRMLIEAGRRGVVRAVALCAALTQGRGVWVRRAGKEAEMAREDALGDAPSDFFLLMRAWEHAAQAGFCADACRPLGIHAQAARAVAPVYDAFLKLARQQGLALEEGAVSEEAIAKCILSGFADHVAKRMDGGTLRCEVVHGRRGRLDEESVVRRAPLLVAANVREIEGRELEVVLSLATAIRPEWLEELYPDDMGECVQVGFHRVEKRVIAERQKKYRDLVLESKREQHVPEDAAAEMLASEVLAGSVTIRGWDETVERYIRRVNFLAEHAADQGWTPMGADARRAILEQVCHGHFSQRDLREAEVWGHVRGWLSGSQQAALEREAPERIQLKNGFRARVLYPEQGPPRFSARIQDLYGTRTLPALAFGRVLPALEILAPNQRPVQITQDLPGFWRDTYPSIRQEYARKYPKHEWRAPDAVIS